MTRSMICMCVLALGACAAPQGTSPSLAPRAAEQIDPRIPVVAPPDTRPADAALVARLRALSAQARDGDTAFVTAAAEAERLAAAAASPQSESWVVAQQALSAAVAARGATTRALGDVDELEAQTLATKGGISAPDRAAIEATAAEISAIERRQAERIDAIARRLGS